MKKAIPVIFLISFLLAPLAQAEPVPSDSDFILEAGGAGCVVGAGVSTALALRKHSGEALRRATVYGCGSGYLLGTAGAVAAAGISEALADEAPSEAQLNNSESPEQPQE